MVKNSPTNAGNTRDRGGVAGGGVGSMGGGVGGSWIHGWGYSPWGGKELEMIELTKHTAHTSLLLSLRNHLLSNVAQFYISFIF